MELPSEVPVMTLPNATLFPGAMLPLYIFEPRYRRMLKDALHSQRVFAIAMKKPECKREIPSTVAGLGLIRVAVTRTDGTSYLILQGLSRVVLLNTIKNRPYRVELVRSVEATNEHPQNINGLTEALRHLVAERLQQGGGGGGLDFQPSIPAVDTNHLDTLAAYSMKHFLKFLSTIDDGGQVADLVSCTMLPTPAHRQLVLETFDIERRLECVIRFLKEEIKRQSTP